MGDFLVVMNETLDKITTKMLKEDLNKVFRTSKILINKVKPIHQSEYSLDQLNKFKIRNNGNKYVIKATGKGLTSEILERAIIDSYRQLVMRILTESIQWATGILTDVFRLDKCSICNKKIKPEKLIVVNDKVYCNKPCVICDEL